MDIGYIPDKNNVYGWNSKILLADIEYNYCEEN